MQQLSKIGMKFPDTKNGVLFFLRNDLTSRLGLDGRKIFDIRHTEDIPPEFNAHRPFTVIIYTQEGCEEVSLHDDFASALHYGEKTKIGTKATIQDKDQNLLAEVVYT